MLSKKDNSPSLAMAALDAGNYIAQFSPHVLLLAGGLSIVKGVQACFQYCTPSESQNTIICKFSKTEIDCYFLKETLMSLEFVAASMCYNLLCRPWFTASGIPERGAIFNQHVDVLLKIYFSTVNDKLQEVKKIAQIAVDEVQGLNGKDSVMETFRTINK